VERPPRLLLILTALILALPFHAARAAGEGGRYYPESGHTLDDLFVEYFDRQGGASVLGFPITESFVDPYSGLLVQYSENARLELAPNPEDGTLQVRIAELGVLMGGWDLPLKAGLLPIGRNPGCRYYDETGHQVCHAFLDFYVSNGSSSTFGLPITEFRIENFRVVQYFERFRLDWFPEAGEGERIRVAPLGEAHFELMGYAPGLLSPVVPGDLENYMVLDLRLSASVLRPLVGQAESQWLYLAVSDQNYRPVEGAAALLTINLPDATLFKMMPLTDRNGVTQIEIEISDQLPGTRLALEYTVVFENLYALTRDSFYMWW
jgi:hypothetical protein